MNTATVIDTARSALGTVGVYLPLPFNTATSIGAQREAVGRLERAGYQAAWTNEPLGGKDALVQLGILLAETRRMAYGTGIANIWARQPQTAHGASALLADAYPGRFVLGLGVGYPEQAASTGQEFGRPRAPNCRCRSRDAHAYRGRLDGGHGATGRACPALTEISR